MIKSVSLAILLNMLKSYRCDLFSNVCCSSNVNNNSVLL